MAPSTLPQQRVKPGKSKLLTYPPLKTVNELTTNLYWRNILNGDIALITIPEGSHKYFIIPKFMAANNDFSEDNTLIYRVFCYLPLETMIQGNDLFLQYKGALTEQFVFQQLCASDVDKIAYWTNDRSTSEVDFIVQREGKIIPIEVTTTP